MAPTYVKACLDLDEARWKEAFKTLPLGDFTQQRLEECISTRDRLIQQQSKLMSGMVIPQSPSGKNGFLTEIRNSRARIEKLNAGQWLDEDLLKIKFDNPFFISYPHIYAGPTGVDPGDVHEEKTTKDLLNIEEHVFNLLHIAVFKNCRSFETAYILSVWAYIRSRLVYRFLYNPRAYLHGFYKISEEENSFESRKMTELVVLSSRLFLLKMMSLYHGYYNLPVPDEFEGMLNQLIANLGEPIEFKIVEYSSLLCRAFMEEKQTLTEFMKEKEILTEDISPQDPLRFTNEKFYMLNTKTKEFRIANLDDNYTLKSFQIEPIEKSSFFKILPSISIGITPKKEDGNDQKKHTHRGGKKHRHRGGSR